MKKHRVLRNILIDLVCTGLVLIVFALFHHVLPRQQQSLGIVISNPYQNDGEDNDSGLSLPEEIAALFPGCAARLLETAGGGFTVAFEKE